MPCVLSFQHRPSKRLTLGARRLSSGFTLMEVMVVVAILGILAALAGPSFTPILERWRVRDSAEALTSTLYYARSEAIKRGGGITIDATGGWDNGWKVNHIQNSTTTELKVHAAPSRVSIVQSNNEAILYMDRWGMISESISGTPAAMDIAVYPTGKTATDTSAIRLCIAGGGRIVQMKQGAACP